MIKRIALLSMSTMLLACLGSGDHGDLRSYIDQIKARPAGSIDPLPTFRPYESFIYSAAAKRSPFDRPIEVQRTVYAQSNSNVKPDFNRTKEYLEGFDLTSMSMVGNITKSGVLWALIADPSGVITWVKNGNYIGKNHGRIVETTENKIELLEIVSDGLDGWVERPRIIALSEEKE